MNYNTLENYYRVMFSMVHNHKYSIADVEGLIPFERELYIDLITQEVNRQQRELERQTGKVFAFDD